MAGGGLDSAMPVVVDFRATGKNRMHTNLLLNGLLLLALTRRGVGLPV